MSPFSLGILGSARVAAASGYPITDSFNRANGAPGVTDTGQTWTLVGGSISIVSNQLQLSGSGVVTATVPTPSIDMAAEAKFVTRMQYTQIACRGVSFLLFISGTAGAISVRANGSDASTGVSCVAGDVLKLSLKEEGGGTRVRAYRNGTEIYNVLDSRGARDVTTKTAGVGGYINGGTFDDFKVDAP